MTCVKEERATSLTYREVLARVGLPAQVIPSFALHGKGAEIVYGEDSADVVFHRVLSLSPIGEVLVRRV